MCRLKIDRCRDAVLQSVFPTRDANAPLLARLQSGKPPFRMRRDQIVPVEHGEIEKLAGSLHANSVLPHIFGAGATITIAIKSGEWIATTAAKLRAKNISRHERQCVEAMKRSSVEAKIANRKLDLF